MIEVTFLLINDVLGLAERKQIAFSILRHTQIYAIVRSTEFSRLLFISSVQATFTWNEHASRRFTMLQG